MAATKKATKKTVSSKAKTASKPVVKAVKASKSSPVKKATALAKVAAGKAPAIAAHPVKTGGQPAKASGQPAKASGQPAKAGGQLAKAGGKKLTEREKRILRIKERLSRQKNSLLYEAETSKNALPDQTIFPDLGDQASVECDRNFMLKLRGREQRLLKKIEEAIERIDVAVFGICDICGEEIKIERLEARPVTTLCINCKTEQEEEEKLTGQ